MCFTAALELGSEILRFAEMGFVVFPAVEDQKELASPVSPELRQKEVQMNFLNQLTSVFNPRVSSSPSITTETQVKSL